MDFSGMVDVAVGMAFIFLLFSLMCSALVEMLESLSRKRGRLLWQGLTELFLGNEYLVKKFYQQPFIYILFQGDSVTANSTKLPSYIPERNFTFALASMVLHDKEPTVANFKAALSTSELPAELQQPLAMIAHLAGDDWAKFMKSLEDFYLSSTERLSGRYKRHSQWVAFICALLIAAAANLDSLTLVNSLMTDPQLRGSLVKSAESYLNSDLINNKDQFVPLIDKKDNDVTATLDKYTLTSLAKNACTDVAASTDNKSTPDATATTANKPTAHSAECRYYASLLQIEKLGLPIGWNSSNPRTALPESTNSWLNKITGILLTAIGVSLGAPFWFDLLNKFMTVRTAVKSMAVREKTVTSKTTT